jgi:hypothetical protein
MQLDENGEFELKPEYRGKIAYHEGDFFDRYVPHKGTNQ